MAYWVVSKTLWKYWRSRMRISANGPGHFRAFIRTHKVKPVVCSFMDCHAVQSCCWSQAGFCLTYSSFSGTTQTLEKGTKHLAVLLAFSFSLHLRFEAWCLSPSLPLPPTPTHRLQKPTLLPAPWRFPLHPGFPTSSFPFPEENQSVHHLKVFPNPLSPLTHS